MKLTVVGCSGAVPGPSGPASCYLIEAHEDGRTYRLVLDLGAGAFGALQRYCDPRDIDVVAVSHLHPDHCADLAALHVHHSYHPQGPFAVTVMGPFGTASRITQMRGSDSPSRQLDVQVWQPDRPATVGPMTVTATAVEHSVPAYAIRVEGPSELAARSRATIAYSGDCGPNEGLIEAARDADLLVCEASLETPSDDVLHLTGTQAGAVATQARADRLLVTHIPPWLDPNTVMAQAKAAYDGHVDLAVPGLHVTV